MLGCNGRYRGRVAKQNPRSGPKRSRGGSTPSYPRTARLSEILKEIIADELTLIDDERLELVTITAVDVDPEMNRAIVFYDSMEGEEGDEEIELALNDHRRRIQSSINRQMHARRTPVLSFKADEVIRAAARIEAVLREDRKRATGDDAVNTDGTS